MRRLAVLAALILLAGCAESSAEVSAPSAWDQAAQRALAGGR